MNKLIKNSSYPEDMECLRFILLIFMAQKSERIARPRDLTLMLFLRHYTSSEPWDSWEVVLPGDSSQVMFYHDGETLCSVLTCFGVFARTNPLPGQYTLAQMFVLDILQQSGGLSAPTSSWIPDNDWGRGWGGSSGY